MKLIHADCHDALKLLDDESVDAIVTDPPYGLEFMGKAWDKFTGAGMSKPGIGQRETAWPSFTGTNTRRCKTCGLLVGHGGSPCQCEKPVVANMIPERMVAYQAYMTPIFEECLRVLKPGGHLLAFGGSRTYHRLASAIEDAGFEIRDQIMWIYGSGFPKSLDVSKAIDAKTLCGGSNTSRIKQVNECRPGEGRIRPSTKNDGIMGSDGGPKITKDAPATSEARKWQGWGTALKPAHEPLVLARKPLVGTVAENVLKHGTGGINVDGCRVPLDGDYKSQPNGRPSLTGLGDNYDPANANQPDTVGRWPANVIHDGSREVTACFPEAKGQQGDLKNHKRKSKSPNGIYGEFGPKSDHPKRHEESKSAARFFYCAASRQGEASADRRYTEDGGTNFAMLPGERRADRAPPAKFFYCAKANKRDRGEGNNHPTVKPTELMRYLVRLVTPPGGTVLDPFMGSGSTGKACKLEGFDFIGIEKELDYYNIAVKRCA